MEAWVERALQRWPNVPALYGWLQLDRRGRWRIRGELITRPQIIDTIARNYAADAHGCWYFQNGPQRGYMELEYAPLVLFAVAEGDTLHTHTGLELQAPSAAYLDEQGALVIVSEHGPGVIADRDLDWALARLSAPEALEDALAAALDLSSGTATALVLQLGTHALPVQRLDFAAMPATLGFVRKPQPEDVQVPETKTPPSSDGGAEPAH